MDLVISSIMYIYAKRILKISFMSSQIWGYMNSLYYSFGLYHFFPSEKQLFFLSEVFSYYCKQVSVLLYEIFDTLKQQSIENQYIN